MNKHSLFRQPLAIILTLCLIVPGPALAVGKSGKKNFNAGMKYEAAQQWDLAAQEFALAVAAEPGNAEYRLHLHRAMLNASIMFMKRGNELAEQQDYASAYNAYRQAFAYDQTNEIARLKMAQMVEQQKIQAGLSAPVKYNQIGNFVPTSGEINTAQKPRPKDVAQAVEFKDTSLKLAITSLAKQLGLNVLFDETFKDNSKFSISLQNVTLPKALDFILLQSKNVFEQLDRRTLLIYPDNQTNRQKFERLMVKTFYLANADLNETRTVVQQMLLPANRPIAAVNKLNALVVRGTAQDLRLVQDIIDRIDKNRSEVVIDVDIYEVSHSTSLELGNQLATSPRDVAVQTGVDKDGKPVFTTRPSASLTNLGGVGLGDRITGIAGSGIVSVLGGSITTPFLGGVGTLFGLPPTSLSLLQSKGNSKLLASTQIHALDGEQNQTVVGRSVPVRVGTNFVPGFSGGGAPVGAGGGAVGGAIQGGLQGAGLVGGGFNTGAFDSIQYRDVGLVIDVTPSITNEGYVQVKMKLESSNVEASGADATLTPSFTKRSLTTISRVQDGRTAVVAGVKQESKGDTRATIPVIGMVPILGRFFSTPKQSSFLTDIVITVTPHIIRTSEIKPEDHLAGLSGPMAGGMSPTIEDVVERAQVEDEQDRRVIAQQQGQPAAPFTTPAQVAQTTAPSLTPSPKVETANFAASAPVNPNPVNINPAPANGLTPPPPVNVSAPAPRPPVTTAFQPEPPANNTTRPPVQNVNLTNTAPAPPPASASSAQSAPAIPVPTPSVANVVESADTAPAPQNQPPRRPNRTADDEVPEEARQYITQPPAGVKPAQVVSAPRPEHVEQAIREAAKVEASRKPAPDPTPAYVPVVEPGPKEPVPLAVPKAARPTLKPKSDQPGAGGNTAPGTSANPAGPEAAKGEKANTKATELAVGLSLHCQQKQQVGKSFIVVVSVTGDAALTNASLALKFDPAKLQLKAVRDGGLLGNHADISHQVKGGNLTITMEQAQGKAVPMQANSKLLVLEFKALEPGPTQIDFVNDETQLKLTGNLSARVSSTPAQLQISREAVSLEK
jgi:general secretion pathway protein D